MRLAVLGNSHAACLMSAVRDVPDVLGGVEPVFFASVAQNMRGLKSRGGRLVPTEQVLKEQITRSSRGIASIDPASYDAFLLIGMDFEIFPVPLFYSSQVRQLAWRQARRDMVHWHLADVLRQITDRPILCGHQPLRANAPVVDGPEMLSYDETLGEIAQHVADLSVYLLAQPEETRLEDLYTQPRFTRGSTKLSSGKPHPDEDRIHMNTEYGAIYLRHLAKRLEAL